MIINIFLLIIVITIIICNNKEYFKQDKSINYLSPNSSCKRLKNVNESYDYNELDLKLRNINSKIYYDEIYKFYCNNMIDFTKKDKILLTWCFDNLKKHTPDHLLFIYDNLNIGKYNNFIENGFPHTNNNIIFLSEEFINNILGYYNDNNVIECIKNIGSVLIHECIHIWQFRQPDKFDNLYKNYWHFLKTDKIHNSEKYENIKRFNPDGKDTNWVFNYNNKYIWFLSTYTKNAKNISHVKYIGINLTKLKNSEFLIEEGTNIDDLLNITEFNSFFQNLTGNHYHVNEISAELLCIYYLKSMNISHKKFTNKAYRAMLIWLNKTL